MTNGPTSRRLRSLALISSYVPHQCGIAPFCKDLYDAVAGELEDGRCLVVALDDREEGYRYPDEVRFELIAERPREYANAADLININQVDVALVQHEFGIFGGDDG
ncbi:MAG: glycosyl transferase family 1, partial [Planctomycetota bacterium]